MAQSQWEARLMSTARSIAALEQEDFGVQHLYRTMDELIPGPAYTDKMSVAEKLNALVERAAVYISFDRFLVKNGAAGNADVESPIKRIDCFDAHIRDILRPCTSDREKRDALLRFYSRVNGLFLAREVLNKDFTFAAHQELFNFFVQKDPFRTLEDLDPIFKSRLCLMPRGAYKSSSNAIDVTQWVICYPNVRGMILTATLSLAKSFISEIKNFFVADNPEDPESFTPFQSLFAPENFLIRDLGKESEMICPARNSGDQRKKEPTLRAGSVGGSKTGTHLTLLILDDACDETNSETPELCAKIKRKIGMAQKLIDPGGYFASFATPYNPADFNNQLRTDGDDVLRLIRPARVLKVFQDGSTAVQNGRSPNELRMSDYSLLFSYDKNGRPKLTYKQLQKNQQEDPENFPSQYLLDAHGYKPIVFADEVVQRAIISTDQMPVQMKPLRKFILCDLASTQEWYSDFTCLSTVAIDEQERAYVVDLVRGKYGTRDVCYQIALANHTHKPLRIVIENARGADNLEDSIRRAAADMGDFNIPLEFVPVDNKKDAKQTRIRRLQALLEERRLFFLSGLEYLEDLISELKAFPAGRHDDIIDSIAYISHVLSQKRGGPTDQYSEQLARMVLQNKEFEEMIFAGPEAYIDVPIQPLPDTGGEGTGDNAGGEPLFDPFGVPSFRR